MDTSEDQPMSVITKVERQKKNKHRVNIFLDDEYAFSVHEDMMIKHRLLKEETVNREKIELAVAEDERHEGYLEAIRYIGRRPRSVKEVELHLKTKGYEPQQIQEISERLLAERILNDGTFAKLWTEHRILTQNKGRRWVEMELSQKGVPDEDISAALGEVDREEEFQSAWVIGSKKWRITGGELPDRKRKVMTFLLRRGYVNDTVYEVVKKLVEQEKNKENID